MDDKYGIRWGMFDDNGDMKEACKTCSGSGLKDFKFYDDAPHVGTAVCTKCNGSGE
jgi:DnaJ-class molecular chaperone